MTRFLVASAMGAGLMAGLAIAQDQTNVGSVTGITGDTGAVVVQRGTETFSLGPDDQIFEGDKIVTRAAGTVEITAFGCTVSVPSEATVTVNAQFCNTPPVTVASQTTPPPDPTVGAGTPTVGGLPVVGVVGAVAGVGVIAAASSGGGDDDDAPTSP